MLSTGTRTVHADTVTNQADSPLKLMLITQREANDPFWGIVEDIAEVAAEDFGIEIFIRHAQSNNLNIVRFIEEAATLGVNGVIFPNYRKIVSRALEMAEKHQVHTILFNAGPHPDNQAEIGKPGEYYQYWLAQSLPDDEHAGYLLANMLIERARAIQGETAKLEMVGITGTLVEGPSLLRKRGLERAVAEHENVDLKQVVFADWQLERAAQQTRILNMRYPQATLYWAASDLMAVGISDTLSELGHQPGKSHFVGGVDWANEGLDAVINETITTSIGGHIFEGAWAVILFHDFFNGVNITQHLPPVDTSRYPTSVSLLSPMKPVNQSHIQQLRERVAERRWSDIDFQRYSIHLNPAQQQYAFFLPKPL